MTPLADAVQKEETLHAKSVSAKSTEGRQKRPEELSDADLEAIAGGLRHCCTGTHLKEATITR